MFKFIPFFLQIPVEVVDGIQKASETSVVAGVLSSIIFVLFGVLIYIFKLYQNEIKINKKNSTASLELLQKNNDDINKIRENIQNRDDERFEKSLATEKEMVSVLNGVNSIMSLSDKMSQKDNKLILDKLDEIKAELKK